MADWREVQLRNRLKELLKGGKTNYTQIAVILSEEFGSDFSRSAVRHAAMTYFPGITQRVTASFAQNAWSPDELEILKNLANKAVSFWDLSCKFGEATGRKISKESARRMLRKHHPDIADTFKERSFKPKPQNVVEEENVVDEIIRDKEVLRLKMANINLQRKYREALKEQVLEENILSVIQSNILALKPVPPPKRVTKQSNKVSQETAVVAISDTHIGEKVSDAETGGLSHYDFDTFRYRLQYMSDAIINILKHKLNGYDIRTLHVCFLGDMVSGMIHEELIESAQDTVIEWTTGGALVIAQFLQELAQEFDTIICPCVVGNHGRMKKQVTYKHKYVNWDYILYNQLSLMLQNQKNIEFIIPKSFYLMHEIENHNFLLLHGDNIRGWQGIPWYGIQKAAHRLSELLNNPEQFIDYIMMGHFHNSGSLDRVHGGQLLLNGSMIGGNEFSIGCMFASNQPKQILMGVHPRKGKTFQYDINLKFAPETGPIRYQYDSDVSLISQVRDTVFE